MSLMDAPEYNEKGENRIRAFLVGGGLALVMLIVLGLGGLLLGHGWFFMNLPQEHRVNNFLSTLEEKDYAKAYGIWENDPNWQQHPEKYADYPLKRFTEDWTTASDWGPIRSHHVDISKRDGSGVIVAARINSSPKKLFLWYERKNGTLTYSPHELDY